MLKDWIGFASSVFFRTFASQETEIITIKNRIMLNKEDKKVQKFINQCADFCKTAGLKTLKEVYDWLVADLTDTYKGRAPKWKIESVAEDITESICLKLNIHQKGIPK